MEYRINEIREQAQRLLNFCDLAEKGKYNEERIRETVQDILNRIKEMHYNIKDIEYKKGEHFLFETKEGIFNNIKFVEGDSLGCKRCVLEGRRNCLKCIDYEREDELNGYYVYADSAGELARKYLGKEIDYDDHKGMVVGYCEDDIILSFSDGYGWTNIEDNRYNKLLIHSELNKGFLYVDKNIL